MTREPSDVPATDDLNAELERALIAQFLSVQGHDLHTLRNLPKEQAERLLKEASLYASTRLTEVESRARYVHEVHGVPES
jgi:hypothetical protein